MPTLSFSLCAMAAAISFENELVSFEFDEDASELTIRGKVATKLDDDTVDAVLNRTELLLRRNATFKTRWDLRNVAVPSLATATRCVQWAWHKKRSLDQLNVRMLVILPAQSASMLRIVNFVLRAFGPKCPIQATADEDAGVRWWRSEDAPPRD